MFGILREETASLKHCVAALNSVRIDHWIHEHLNLIPEIKAMVIRLDPSSLRPSNLIPQPVELLCISLFLVIMPVNCAGRCCNGWWTCNSLFFMARHIQNADHFKTAVFIGALRVTFNNNREGWEAPGGVQGHVFPVPLGNTVLAVPGLDCTLGHCYSSDGSRSCAKFMV